MKLSALLYIAASACVSFTTVLATPCRGDFDFQLQSGDDDLLLANLPSHLGGQATFYRAVTGRERAVVATNYPVGGHPAKPLEIAGDFSPNGAVYVFSDLTQAIKWGDGWSKGLPDPKWYLVTFKYTPITGMKIKSFSSGTAEWKTFVNANYQSGGTSPYDAVEGPVSHGSGSTLAPYLEGGNMVYEAGFMNNGLKSLVVTSVATRTAGGGEWCKGFTGAERSLVSKNYPVGGHPAKPNEQAGNLSPNGAVYVFHDLQQALNWGDSRAKLRESDKTWFLITFKYRPVSGLKTKSFSSGTSEWLAFIKGNYKGGTSQYDIVEGPIEVSGKAYIENGNMIYEAAFMNNGLKALTVTAVTPKVGGGKKWCEGCNIL
ncbi:hypothetical protein CVT24_012618 [Panaeolus cyanescens]|uniref:Uncharacterized protein n=1 Tax=Panaeolus cyanescens TaxID=181874 RepID=A0A409W678_9AGAR|nr:hypothetical protein CVT24_012618 [Panaeolus cyanescens]